MGDQTQDKLNFLKTKYDALDEQVRLLTQQTLNVESLAGKRVPYSYVIDITINQGVDELQEGQVQVSRSGPFFAERIYASLRINTMQDGGDASLVGRQLPISSRSVYPFIWPAGATGTQTVDPPLDFTWGYSSTDSDRERQNSFLPGDLLERSDSDGIFAVSDIFSEGATINFQMAPLRPIGNNAPWSDADGVASFVFSAIFWGYKIIQPAQM